MGTVYHSVWDDDSWRKTMGNATDPEVSSLHNELARAASGQGNVPLIKSD